MRWGQIIIYWNAEEGCLGQFEVFRKCFEMRKYFMNRVFQDRVIRCWMEEQLFYMKEIKNSKEW